MFGEDGKSYRCSLRGKFQKDFNLKKDKLYKLDIAAVGDFVEFEPNNDNTGVIIKIEKRTNYIARKAPRIKGASKRGERLEQIIASNVDTLVVVSSTLLPEFNNRLIDRLIVAAESSGVDAAIVINKIDLLLDDTNINLWSKLYKGLGYNVFLTAAIHDKGTNELLEYLKGKTNLFWGQSGVGKSSLLNSLYPTLDLKTGDISTFTNKGQHTTVTSLLTKIDDITYVIDTPGIREIDPYGIQKEDLYHYFKEFVNYAEDCKFNTCTHGHEPGCAVKKAVENKQITKERYISYLNILETIEEDMFF